MPPTSNNSGLTFSVDGQLIGELGERLVTRNHVALSELIKNSYDADSYEVSVDFCDLTNSDGDTVSSIVLDDSGNGMSYTEVRNHWMRIATDNKLRNPVSPKYGRPKTGNKGIGRFSCQRLAKELVLETVAEDSGKYIKTTVTFHWSDFSPGSDLTEIPCQYETIPIQTEKTGTRLKLIGLRDSWTQRDFDTLRRSIVQLAYAQETKRKGFITDPGFAISVNAESFERGRGPLLDQVIDAGWGRLHGKVLNNGRLRLALNGKYLDKGRSYRSDARYQSFAGLEFTLSFLAGMESYDLNRDPKTLTRNVLKDVREHCGIRVYFDGFRVFPYGELGDDWLRLDRDYAARKSSIEYDLATDVAKSLGLESRSVSLLRPRNDNLLGRVFLAREQNHGLQVKINREGFIDSQSYRQLTEILRQSIEWMTVHYAYAKSEHQRRKAEAAEKAFREAVGRSESASHASVGDTEATAIHVLSQFASSYAKEANDQDAAIAANQATEFLEVSSQQTKNELSTLRSLASTAPLLFTFSHEVSALISRLDTHASSLKVLAKQLSDREHKQDLQKIAEDLLETRKNFNNLYSLFGLVAQSRRGTPRKLYVRRALQKLIAGAKFSTDGANIEVVLDCDSDTKTPKIVESEFVSIIVNLYSNAIKSTLAKGGDKIRILVTDSPAQLDISILDTGVGLEKQHWQEVKKPFVSDPGNQIYKRLESNVGDTVVASLGRGSGLGLSIVDAIVKKYKGELTFFKRKGWSIGIKVTLPRG